MEEKKFKVGHIIVVVDGDAGGNLAGTITCVTAVNMDKHMLFNKSRHNYIVCRAARAKPGAKHYRDCKPNHINVKIPSYYERINDVRHATPEEKKLYWEGVKNEKYW